MSFAPAADAALRILALLARQAEPVPAGLISATLDLPRSTTYRLLGTLIEQGFVSYLPEERRYGLGVVSFELGSAYARQMPLRRIAHPVLSRLVDQVGQNAHLAVLHGSDVYYVIEERASGQAPLVSDVGVRLPATLTASGLAMLSRLTSAQLCSCCANRSRSSSTRPAPSGPIARHQRSSPTSNARPCCTADSPCHSPPEVISPAAACPSPP